MNLTNDDLKSSSLKVTQHFKVDNFKNFIEAMSDLKISKVTDTHIHLVNGMQLILFVIILMYQHIDSLDIVINKEKFIDSMFSLSSNEISTDASSGNRDTKNSVNIRKPSQDPISYFPFNPSMLTSQEIKTSRFKW